MEEVATKIPGISSSFYLLISFISRFNQKDLFHRRDIRCNNRCKLKLFLKKKKENHDVGEEEEEELVDGFEKSN